MLPKRLEMLRHCSRDPRETLLRRNLLGCADKGRTVQAEATRDNDQSPKLADLS